MNKFINIHPFIQSLFDDQVTANKAAEIGQAILVARSLRLTEIAVKMRRGSAASYKRLQRFVKQTAPRETLRCRFREIGRTALTSFIAMVHPLVPTHV